MSGTRLFRGLFGRISENGPTRRGAVAWEETRGSERTKIAGLWTTQQQDAHIAGKSSALCTIV